jgi:hypothetical protein
VKEVDDDETVNGVVINNITNKEVAHDAQIEDEKDGVSY